MCLNATRRSSGYFSRNALIVGVTRAQEEVRSGRSLETYWQQYDAEGRLLVPGGRSIVTSVDGGIFSEPGYLKPTVSVLEVDPGAYALIGAGFPNFMTLFVRSNDPLSRYKSDNPGQIQSWTYTVDPRRHINPEAPVDPKENILFSVAPGQIVYIGHFRFWKLPFSDKFASIGYSQDVADVAAAREALKDFPGIAGDMTVQDLRLSAETAAR